MTTATASTLAHAEAPAAATAQAGALAPIATTGAVSHALDTQGFSGLEVGKPFAEPILLMEDVKVAGTTHVDDIEEVLASAEPGARLDFRRDVGNAFDCWTIKVYAPDGRRMGFVPASQNEVLARMMDAGKRIYAVMTEKETLGMWNRVTMEVYLDD